MVGSTPCRTAPKMLNTSPKSQMMTNWTERASALLFWKFCMIWGENTTTQQAIDTDPQMPDMASTSRFRVEVGGAIMMMMKKAPLEGESKWRLVQHWCMVKNNKYSYSITGVRVAKGRRIRRNDTEDFFPCFGAWFDLIHGVFLSRPAQTSDLMNKCGEKWLVFHFPRFTGQCKMESIETLMADDHDRELLPPMPSRNCNRNLHQQA